MRLDIVQNATLLNEHAASLDTHLLMMGRPANEQEYVQHGEF